MTEPRFGFADFSDRLPTAEETDSAAEALTAIEIGRNSNGALPIGDALLSSPSSSSSPIFSASSLEARP